MFNGHCFIGDVSDMIGKGHTNQYYNVKMIMIIIYFSIVILFTEMYQIFRLTSRFKNQHAKCVVRVRCGFGEFDSVALNDNNERWELQLIAWFRWQDQDMHCALSCFRWRWMVMMTMMIRMMMVSRLAFVERERSDAEIPNLGRSFSSSSTHRCSSARSSSPSRTSWSAWSEYRWQGEPKVGDICHDLHAAQNRSQSADSIKVRRKSSLEKGYCQSRHSVSFKQSACCAFKWLTPKALVVKTVPLHQRSVKTNTFYC